MTKGVAYRPRVTLSVESGHWQGWTEVEISRAIDPRGCGTFRVGLAERRAEPPEQAQRRAVRPGDACAVAIDGEPVLRGYVDDVAVTYDGQSHTLTVTGRDAVGDLIDCAATVDGPYEYAGLDLGQVAARLCAPYGIAVTVDTDVGRPIARFALQPGETAWSAIERGCRQRAVLPVADGLGGLRLTRAGTASAPGRLQLGGDDGNVLRCDGLLSHRDRYSHYICVGTGEGGEDASLGLGAQGVAEDPAVRRYRPTVIVGESAGDARSYMDRATWQRQVAAGRSRQVRYTVQGWRGGAAVDPREAGLWRPNQLVPVSDKWLGLDREMLITGVAYTLSDQGSLTELDVALPEAYALMAAPEETGDGLAGGGGRWAEVEPIAGESGGGAGT